MTTAAATDYVDGWQVGRRARRRHAVEIVAAARLWRASNPGAAGEKAEFAQGVIDGWIDAGEELREAA